MSGEQRSAVAGGVQLQSVEVLVIEPISAEAMHEIEEVHPRVHVVDARGWFDPEIRQTWPERAVQRYIAHRSSPETTREERDRALANAEVVLGGWPYPLDLRSRSPRLRWFHQRPAGASNLLLGDLWESDVLVTTSRGHGNTRPMAEYVLGAFMYFARGFHRAAIDKQRQEFDHRAYRPVSITGKTVCVIGAGGIGGEIARICSAAGMSVVGTRRSVPDGTELPIGFDRLESADRLTDLLAESSFVAVSCPWTPETTGLIGTETLAAMRPETVLVNVSRGEVVDEHALLEALDSGRLRGAALDVFTGEFERTPNPRLWKHDRVLITPHISGGSDVMQHRGIELFCQNLRAYLDGRPLENVIDWRRGY
jgi:glyoxylate/hydroxypyruvate reductase